MPRATPVQRRRHAAVVLALECDRDLIRVEWISIDREEIQFGYSFRRLDKAVATVRRTKHCKRTGPKKQLLGISRSKPNRASGQRLGISDTDLPCTAAVRSSVYTAAIYCHKN